MPIAGPQRWQRFADITDVFSTEADPGWEHDRDLIDDRLHDPWNGV